MNGSADAAGHPPGRSAPAPLSPDGRSPAPPPPVRRGRPGVLVGALWLLALAVLVQASLAGLFLSGVSGARLAHVIVGWLLPFAAIGVAVVAGVAHARRTVTASLAIAVYPLPVLLWIQEVLGHVPFPVTTAIHVPLGVTLTVYPAVLAVLATRSRRTD